jgi:hypothetical protein
MQSFQFASQINRKGMLNLQLPPDFANQEVDIVLVINTKKKATLPERPIGQYAGKMKMSDDFSAPLRDEFWLGEE